MKDARGRLVSDPFTYREDSRGALHIARGGRVVVMLSPRDSARLLPRLQAADEEGVQQLLARATGQYRMGTRSGGRG